MRKITRLWALVLSSAILFSLAVSVGATESGTGVHSVTVSSGSMTGSFEKKDGGCLLKGKQSVSADFDIAESGKYTVKIKYVPVEIRNETVDCAFKIDGEYPENFCSELALPVLFKYAEKKFKKDSEGNELVPDLVLDSSVTESYISDSEGLVYGAYEFELSKGSHSMVLSLLEGSMILNSVTFEKSADVPTYKEYISGKKASGSGKIISFEAERPDSRTSKAITEFCDFSSNSVFPEAEKLRVMNAVGGSQWKYVGQEITWKFNVAQTDLYKINFRYKQNYTNGRSTYRAILIDGKLPFEELKKTEFRYTGSWDVMTVGGEEPYLFLLEKGEHTITLQVTLGEMSEIISESRDILMNLNAIYRRVVSITGTKPDPYRDYLLDEKIPETITEMGVLSKRINKVCERLTEIQSRGTEKGALERLSLQLDELNRYPEKCATKLTQFQSDISAFGTWINDRYSHPLAIDTVEISAGKTALKKGGFFGSVLHTVRQFLYSFSDGYSAEREKSSASVDVWALSGRDQVQIINQLVTEKFTPETNIDIRLKLVSEAAVLPATAAGEGPDVCLMVPQTLPINFAIREAVIDLSKFDNFENVRKRFMKEAMVSFDFDSKTYALPETMTFPMLFYRKDILDDLGLSVPKTWDDIRDVIVDLGNNNMQFGFTGAEQNYLTMLYQKGGQLYSDDATVCLLDENVALTTFEEYVAFYRDYGIPVTFDFANRFRSGLMPVAITDYAQYNTLQIFASEINGMWDIAPVPSTVTESGNGSTVAGTVTGCVIFSSAADPDACWSFLEWWTRSDIQEKYGRKVEEKLGASARYTTANIETLKALPWSLSFYESLAEQMGNVKGVPQIPGSYFTSRHFNNAYRNSVYKNANPRETLIEYNRVINDEITVKRKEFGMTTAKGE